MTSMLYLIQNWRYMQFLGTFIAALSISCVSMQGVWPSPTIPKLISENSPIGVTLTNDEVSWVAAIFHLGIGLGCVVTGLIVDKFGRRGSLLMCAIPIFLPWIAIIFVNSAWSLILVRLIGGISSGCAIMTVPMYIGEIADKDIRGKLGLMFVIMKLFGSLFVFSVGPFISYQALAISCSVFPLIFLLLFYFMPESPYFLMKNNNKTAARESFIKLAAKNTDDRKITEQLTEIETIVSNDMKNHSTVVELFSRKYRKPFLIMLGIKTIQQFSGPMAIESYTQTIIQSSGSSISPEISSILCGVIQIPAVLASLFFVDKFGRRPLLVISAVGCAIALIGEGVYFYLQDAVHATSIGHLSWMPTTGLVLFLIMNPMGIFSIPFVLMGELFPTNIKGKAVATLSFYSGILAFVCVKFFNPIAEAWGIFTVFWIFASVCILGCIFILVFLPETKGKTFAEIQLILNKNNNTICSNENVVDLHTYRYKINT